MLEKFFFGTPPHTHIINVTQYPYWRTCRTWPFQLLICSV